MSYTTFKIEDGILTLGSDKPSNPLKEIDSLIYNVFATHDDEPEYGDELHVLDELADSFGDMWG